MNCLIVLDLPYFQETPHVIGQREYVLSQEVLINLTISRVFFYFQPTGSYLLRKDVLQYITIISAVLNHQPIGSFLLETEVNTKYTSNWTKSLAVHEEFCLIGRIRFESQRSISISKFDTQIRP